MSVERNVIITTGEEVITPQKAERIRQEIEHNRKRGEAYAAMLPKFLADMRAAGYKAADAIIKSREEANDAIKSGQFAFSNEDGCSKCNNLCYDLDMRHHVCRLNYRPVQHFTPPCLFFSRILQGFGE